MAERFPLDWPEAYPRTKHRSRAQFKASFGAAIHQIMRELRLMHVSTAQTVISTNQPLRNDGMPYSAQRIISDPGVAVYFKRKGQEVVICCDRWDRIEDNLRAVALTVEAMRGMERWGASDALDRVFRGFTALPAPEAFRNEKPWWEVLGVDETWPLGAIETIWKQKAKDAHPDRGGDPAVMLELNRAMECAREAKTEH